MRSGFCYWSIHTLASRQESSSDGLMGTEPRRSDRLKAKLEPFAFIPDELLCQIISYLQTHELRVAATVSKQWHTPARVEYARQAWTSLRTGGQQISARVLCLAGAIGPRPDHTWADEIPEVLVEQLRLSSYKDDAEIVRRQYTGAAPRLLSTFGSPAKVLTVLGGMALAKAMHTSRFCYRFAACSYKLYDEVQHAINSTPRSKIAPICYSYLTGEGSLTEDPAWAILQDDDVGPGATLVTNVPAFAVGTQSMVPAEAADDDGEAQARANEAPANAQAGEGSLVLSEVSNEYAARDVVMFRSKRWSMPRRRSSLLDWCDAGWPFVLPPLSTVTLENVMPLQNHTTCSLRETRARLLIVTVDYKEQ